MRSIRNLFLLSLALCLVSVLPVAADDAPSLTLEEPVILEEGASVPDLGPMAELLGSPLAGPPVVSLGFGSHCSGPPSPWTCGHTEPGLGCPPGGQCTYTCLCDECTMSDGRVETVAINCTLVDDGGCLACPS